MRFDPDSKIIEINKLQNNISNKYLIGQWAPPTPHEPSPCSGFDRGPPTRVTQISQVHATNPARDPCPISLSFGRKPAGPDRGYTTGPRHQPGPRCLSFSPIAGPYSPGNPYSAGPPPGPRSLPKGQIAGDLIARVQVSRPARDSCRLSPSLGSRQALKLALCCCFVAVLVVLFVVGALLPLRVASPGRCGTLARAASGAHEAPDSDENPCRCCLVRSLQLCRHRNPLKRDTDRAHREGANEER